jgi:hypothetical protein
MSKLTLSWSVLQACGEKLNFMWWSESISPLVIRGMNYELILQGLNYYIHLDGHKWPLLEDFIKRTSFKQLISSTALCCVRWPGLFCECTPPIILTIISWRTTNVTFSAASRHATVLTAPGAGDAIFRPPTSLNMKHRSPEQVLGTALCRAVKCCGTYICSVTGTMCNVSSIRAGRGVSQHISMRPVSAFLKGACRYWCGQKLSQTDKCLWVPVFWFSIQCGLVGGYKSFARTCLVHLQDRLLLQSYMVS